MHNVNWMNLAQDKEKWWELVMNHPVI